MARRLTLYSYWRSSAAYRVRIALNLKGLEYHTQPVHLVRNGGEHRFPEYRAMNPQGLVPLLTDGEHVLSQSLAIIEYLDERYPAPKLLPDDDAAARSHVRAMAQAIACDVHPLNNLRVLKYLASEFGQDDAAKADWYRHWIKEGFSALEQTLSDSAGEFCHGDQPGLADCCLIPQVYNAVRFDCDLQPYPRIRRIDERCLGLDAFKQARPEAQPDAD